MGDHHWLEERDCYRAAIVGAYTDMTALEYLAEQSPVDGQEVA